MSPATEHEDPRRAKSRARVLATAAEILREDGLAGLTIEAVAARSGVAKTTIYRQYDDREALHVATLEMVGSVLHMPVTDDLVADVTAYCKDLAAKLRDGEFGALLCTAVDGSERSPTLAATMREVAAGRRRTLHTRLKSAIADGELPDDTDLELLTGHLVGPIFYRRFFSREPITAAFVTRNVAAALTSLVARTPVRPASRGSGARPRSAD